MIYFDHNASTPVRPEAREAMARVLDELHANPSSLHREGQRARAALERARSQVAALVHAGPDQVIFVSGGTEGDHAGLIGLALAARAGGRTIAFADIEHHAVHGAAEVLEGLGFHAARLPVNERGVLRLESLESAPADTVALALMLANNETGVIQPVPETAEAAHRRGWVVHCDAVQAAGKVPVDFEALGADAMVISAHKLGGPKGVGALILRRGAAWQPLFRGSAHERGRRGGTENLPGIVGFGVAAAEAERELSAEGARLLALRERFERGLAELHCGAVVHGAGAGRLPNTVNASFPGARSDHLLMALDARGVEVSAGAACASGAVEPSPVLTAMGVPRDLAVCAVRFSMGRTTTAEEVDQVLAALAAIVPAARAAAAPGGRA